jgi:hypothetical protein
MEKSLATTMGAMFGLIMIVAVVNMTQSMQPTSQYTCPICGLKFFTYDELYTHFITEHPAEPIEIIWE